MSFHFSDFREEEERKYQERLRVKGLEEENKRLKALLSQHGISCEKEPSAWEHGMHFSEW